MSHSSQTSEEYLLSSSSQLHLAFSALRLIRDIRANPWPLVSLEITSASSVLPVSSVVAAYNSTLATGNWLRAFTRNSELENALSVSSVSISGCLCFFDLSLIHALCAICGLLVKPETVYRPLAWHLLETGNCLNSPCLMSYDSSNHQEAACSAAVAGTTTPVSTITAECAVRRSPIVL